MKKTFRGLGTKDLVKKRKKWIDLQLIQIEGTIKLLEDETQTYLGSFSFKKEIKVGEQIQLETSWLVEIESEIITNNSHDGLEMGEEMKYVDAEPEMKYVDAEPEMKRPRTDAEILSLLEGTTDNSSYKPYQANNSLSTRLSNPYRMNKPVTASTPSFSLTEILPSSTPVIRQQNVNYFRIPRQEGNNTNKNMVMKQIVVPVNHQEANTQNNNMMLMSKTELPSNHLPRLNTMKNRYPLLPLNNMNSQGICRNDLFYNNRPIVNNNNNLNVINLIVPTRKKNKNSNSIKREVFYENSFQDVYSYKNAIKLAWEEEIQEILNQNFEKMELDHTFKCQILVTKYPNQPKRYYLTLNEFNNTKTKSFSLGDIWVLRQGIHEELWESQWYGVSKDNRIEILPLVRNLAIDSLKESIHCIGIRIGSVRTELATLRLLLRSDINLLGFTKTLLGKPYSSSFKKEIRFLLDVGVANDIMKKFCNEFHLNEEQIQVVKLVISKVFQLEQQNLKSDCVLVNGPFGSGKTQTLICCIFILHELASTFLEKEANGKLRLRIGVSAATNVAVDQILSPLVQQFNFQQIGRIGSVRAAARCLLPKMIHHSASSIKDAKYELLKVKESELESIEIVNEALDKLTNACDIASNARVVGFTCCSSSMEEMKLIFQDNIEEQINILFLDEGSQIMEPVALLPIFNSHANYVCIFGDLKQLGSVSPFRVNETKRNDDKICLSTTLFERLSTCFPNNVVDLKKSFRCHPTICQLASDLFYEGSVISGIDEDVRPPMIQNLSPISLIDVYGIENRIGSSYYNDAEIHEIIRLIKKFEDLNIPLEEISIATLFVAQSEMIKKRISNRKIRVATVDSFQGAETEVLIYSHVRTTSSQFSEQIERLNVLLTRAKRHLIVVGSRDALNSSSIWRKVVQRATLFRS